MKKSTLLVVAIPAMLLMASCSAGKNVDKSLLIRANNEGDVLVNIACKHCFIAKLGETPSTAFIHTYSKNDLPATLSFAVTIDEDDKAAFLPSDKSPICFMTDGKEIDTFSYDRKTETEGILSFEPIKLGASKFDIVINATAPCMTFSVSSDVGSNPVTFNYNGAIDHVDWGDGNNKDKNFTHTYSDGVRHEVSVYGNLTSVWFSDRAEPEANADVLSSGNAYISDLSINHTITNLPNYAFYGCDRLEQTFIGSSVTNIGKKVFHFIDPDMGGCQKVIYTAKTSKPETWDADWTDCPVCYGINPEEGEVTSDAFTCRLVHSTKGDVTAMITKHKGDFTGECAFPDTIEVKGYDDPVKVSSIAPFAFFDTTGGTGMNSILLPIHLTEIGDYAFAKRTVSTISFKTGFTPNTTFRVGRHAFDHNSAMMTFTFPNKLKTPVSNLIIDDDAFSGSNLTSIIIPDDFANEVVIGNDVFKDDYQLTAISSTVGKNIFPKNVIKIGDRAFSNAFNLNLDGIIIPEGVTTMGEQVFQGLSGKSVCVAAEGRLPGWSEKWDIAKYDPQEPEKSERINVVWGFVKIIDNSDGFVYNITSKNKIKTATLTKCTQPGSVTIPAYVTDPDEEGVEYNVVKIDKYAFSENQGVTSIQFATDTREGKEGNYNIAEIGERAFINCNNLKDITLPATVTKVGEAAFANCNEKLKVLYRGTDAAVAQWDPKWDSESNVCVALYTNYLDTVEIPGSPLIFAKPNPTENGEEYNASIMGYAQPAVPTKLTIPVSLSDTSGDTCNITSIGDKSFLEADLTSGLEFAEGSKVSSIGAASFRSAKLTENFEIPAHITKIGKYAFYGVAGVKTFSFNTNSPIREIPTGMFKDAGDLETVTLPTSTGTTDPITFGDEAFAGSNIENLDLSNTNATKISDRMFAKCQNYTTLNAPATLTTIGEGSFTSSGVTAADLSNCSQLTEIGNAAFMGCGNLASITLPNGFTTFGDSVLQECNSLTLIDLKALDNFVSLEKHLFGGKLPEKFRTPGQGTILVKTKALMEQYVNDKVWQDMFKSEGQEISQYFDYVH